jgi:hypothetical protein
MESAKRINEKKTITETGGIKGIIDEAKALLWTWFGWFLVNFRWVIVVPVVLPLSFLFEQFWRIRNYWVQDRAPHLHDQRVKQIQEQILKWREGGCKGKLCTARKNWLNTSTKFAKYKATANQIHIDLYDILVCRGQSCLWATRHRGALATYPGAMRTACGRRALKPSPAPLKERTPGIDRTTRSDPVSLWTRDWILAKLESSA